jgi:hypothetical protein
MGEKEHIVSKAEGEKKAEHEEKAYNVLLKYQMNENRVLAERVSIFLLGSSFLFLGFVTLLEHESRFLQLLVPSLGIVLSLLTLFYNWAAHESLNFWRHHLNKIENKIEGKAVGGLFVYMKSEKISPNDLDVRNKGRLYSTLIRFPIFSIGVPLVFLVLWICSLIWVIRFG